MVESQRGLDYWGVLGLEPGADAVALKRAFRDQARRWHPDLNGSDPVAEERFKLVNEAYAVLSDSRKRRAWEEGLAAGGGPGILSPAVSPISRPTSIACSAGFPRGRSRTIRWLTAATLNPQLPRRNPGMGAGRTRPRRSVGVRWPPRRRRRRPWWRPRTRRPCSCSALSRPWRGHGSNWNWPMA